VDKAAAEFSETEKFLEIGEEMVALQFIFDFDLSHILDPKINILTPFDPINRRYPTLGENTMYWFFPEASLTEVGFFYFILFFSFLGFGASDLINCLRNGKPLSDIRYSHYRLRR